MNKLSNFCFELIKQVCTWSLLSPPPKRWGDFNFEKLKSLGRRVFSLYRGEDKPIWGDSDNGNERGGGHNSGQNNYRTITFFARKSNFYRYFQRKNGSQEKLKN